MSRKHVRKHEVGVKLMFVAGIRAPISEVPQAPSQQHCINSQHRPRPSSSVSTINHRCQKLPKAAGTHRSRHPGPPIASMNSQYQWKYREPEDGTQYGRNGLHTQRGTDKGSHPYI
jgi:hypothetical protein